MNLVLIGFGIFVLLGILFFLIYLPKKENVTVLLNRIDGNHPSQQTNEVLHLLHHKQDKTPLELYQIGNLYDHHYGQANLAQQYYTKSIQQIQKDLTYFPQSLLTKPKQNIETQNQNIETQNQHIETQNQQQIQEARIVLDRIQNRIDINDVKEYDEFRNHLPQLIQLQQQVDLAQQQIHIKAPKTTTKQKVEWKIDTQNVHDHYLNDEMVKQFETIKKENFQKKYPIPKLREVRDSLDTILKDEKERKEYSQKIKNAKEMLDEIEHKDQPLVKLNGMREEDFVGHLWCRITHQPNEQELSKSFIQNLNDSMEGRVCVTGRITRLFSSFAHLDSDPKIGMLLTKEVVKNEVLGKAGKIQTDIINSLSSEEKTKYNENKDKILGKQIDDRIRKEIKDMITKDYSQIVPSEVLLPIEKDALAF